MKLLVVVVNYNGFSLTVDCLDSLVPEIRKLTNSQVGLCDNGSKPSEAEELGRLLDVRGWNDVVKYTRLSHNTGFTGGNNAVIRPALTSPSSPEYVWLLNNDTIVRPGAAHELVGFMDSHPTIGIAGSRLEDRDGTPQLSAFRFINLCSEFDRGLQLGLISRLLHRYLTRQPISNDVKQFDWVSGASMIIRRQVLLDIGLLDEAYFTYFDDIDICHSARKHGWLTWYVPSSRVVHLVGQTTGVTARDRQSQLKRKPHYYYMARRRYLTKHLNPVHALGCDLAFLTGGALNRIRCAACRRVVADPAHTLRDHARQSVMLRGFRPPIVENPIGALEQNEPIKTSTS